MSIHLRRHESEEEATQTSCGLLFAQYGWGKDVNKTMPSLHVLTYHLKVV